MSIPIQSNHMKRYKHEYTCINQITQSCYVIIVSNIKISSLGLMIKHEQFSLNHSAKHIFSQKYNFENTILGIVKPSVTIPEKSQINGSPREPAAIHGHSRPNAYQATIQYTINTTYTQTAHTHGYGLLTLGSINQINSVPSFGTDQTAVQGLNQPKHSKGTKNGNKTQVGGKSYLKEFEETP